MHNQIKIRLLAICILMFPGLVWGTTGSNTRSDLKSDSLDIWQCEECVAVMEVVIADMQDLHPDGPPWVMSQALSVIYAVCDHVPLECISICLENVACYAELLADLVVANYSVAAICDSTANCNGAIGVMMETPASGKPRLHSFPNPFNAQTIVTFDIEQTEKVDLRIYDLSGRLVRVLMERLVAGPSRVEVPWNGRDQNGQIVAGGMYFCRLRVAGVTSLTRVALIK